MKTLFIDTSNLPQRSEYICDKQGKHDLVGLILIELADKQNFRIEPGTRTPQQMTEAVYPITIYYRHTIVLTDIGYKLLQATRLPVSQQVRTANHILQQVDINIQPPPEVTAGLGWSF